jgi:hypothetical protein
MESLLSLANWQLPGPKPQKATSPEVRAFIRAEMVMFPLRDTSELSGSNPSSRLRPVGVLTWADTGRTAATKLFSPEPQRHDMPALAGSSGGAGGAAEQSHGRRRCRGSASALPGKSSTCRPLRPCGTSAEDMDNPEKSKGRERCMHPTRSAPSRAARNDKPCPAF